MCMYMPTLLSLKIHALHTAVPPGRRGRAPAILLNPYVPQALLAAAVPLLVLFLVCSTACYGSLVWDVRVCCWLAQQLCRVVVRLPAIATVTTMHKMVTKHVVNAAEH